MDDASVRWRPPPPRAAASAAALNASARGGGGYFAAAGGGQLAQPSLFGGGPSGSVAELRPAAGDGLRNAGMRASVGSGIFSSLPSTSGFPLVLSNASLPISEGSEELRVYAAGAASGRDAVAVRVGAEATITEDEKEETSAAAWPPTSAAWWDAPPDEVVAWGPPVGPAQTPGDEEGSGLEAGHVVPVV